jgi:hypothetical protein
VNSLSAGLPYPFASESSADESHPADVFACAFANAQQKIGTRLWSGPPWPLWEVFGDITQGDVEIIYRFIDPIIERAFEKHLEKKGGHDHEGHTLLDHLISQTDNLELIRDEIVNILIAGEWHVACTSPSPHRRLQLDRIGRDTVYSVPLDPRLG